MDECVKIYRKIKDWEWYREPGMVALWLHLLLTATPEKGEWEIKTSVSKIAKSLGLKSSNVRTGLERLKRSGAISVESNNQFTRIVVINYSKYQGGDVPKTPAPKTPRAASKPPVLPDAEAIDRIYKTYPTKCPIKGTSTGKCSKDKVRIGTLLKTRSEESIVAAIKAYLDDCARDGRFIKNFSTLLNNLPDVDEPTVTYQPEPTEKDNYVSALDLVGDWK